MISKSTSFFGKTLAGLRGSVLEALATRLPVKDRELLMQQWGGSPAPPSPSPLEEKPIIPATAVSTPPPPLPLPSAASFKDRELLHPHFGELIADLGYKRVYLSNAFSLATTPVWEKNRILRPERARKIADFKAKSIALNKGVNKGIPGVITCFQDTSSKRCGIIDGQHRTASLVVMASDGNWEQMKRNILVDVFEASSEEEIISLFKEINSGESVRLVDMPEEGASEEDRTILFEAIESLSRRYSEMFKTSSRCKTPHLNAGKAMPFLSSLLPSYLYCMLLDVLRDELFRAEFIKRHAIKSSAELLNLLEKINQQVGKRMIGGNNTTNVSESALAKCKAHSFYLGLDKDWIKS